MTITLRIPPDASPGVATYLEQLQRAMNTELAGRTKDTEAQHSAIVLSPDGSAWELTVDDTGTITTTKVK